MREGQNPLQYCDLLVLLAGRTPSQHPYHHKRWLRLWRGITQTIRLPFWKLVGPVWLVARARIAFGSEPSAVLRFIGTSRVLYYCLSGCGMFILSSYLGVRTPYSYCVRVRVLRLLSRRGLAVATIYLPCAGTALQLLQRGLRPGFLF